MAAKLNFRDALQQLWENVDSRIKKETESKQSAVEIEERMETGLQIILAIENLKNLYLESLDTQVDRIDQEARSFFNEISMITREYIDAQSGVLLRIKDEVDQLRSKMKFPNYLPYLKRLMPRYLIIQEKAQPILIKFKGSFPWAMIKGLEPAFSVSTNQCTLKNASLEELSFEVPPIAFNLAKNHFYTYLEGELIIPWDNSWYISPWRSVLKCVYKLGLCVFPLCPGETFIEYKQDSLLFRKLRTEQITLKWGDSKTIQPPSHEKISKITFKSYQGKQYECTPPLRNNLLKIEALQNDRWELQSVIPKELSALTSIGLTREDLLIAIFEDERIFLSVSDNDKKDREFVLKALEKNSDVFPYIPKIFQEDEKFIIEAVKLNRWVLKHVPLMFRKNRSVVIPAVKGNGLLLEYADPTLQDEEEIVLEAVQENGTALKYASKRCRDIEKIAFAAYRQNSIAINFMTESLKAKIRNALPFDSINYPIKINLTPPLSNFIGREAELMEMNALLTDLEQFKKKDKISPVKSCLIYGLSGIGKSELACTFAHQNIDRFSLIYWANCENDETQKESYLQMAKVFQINIKPQTSFHELQTAVFIKMETHSFEKPWLLILDDVEEKVFYPKKGGMVIGTSHRKDLWILPDKLIELTPFTLEETIQFMKKVTREDTSSIGELYNILGGWPFAIAQVASFIQSTAGSIKEYLNDLKEEASLLWETGTSRHPRFLLANFQKILERLKTQNVFAYDLINVVAHSTSTSFSLDLINRWIKTKDELKYKNQTLERTKLITILTSYGLIKTDPIKTNCIFHKLVQEFIQNEQKTNKIEKYKDEFKKL